MANIDFARLRADPYWNKKIFTTARSTDADKNGFVDLADFELIVSRYRNNSTANPAHTETVAKAFMLMSSMMGIDNQTRLTYSQFKERFAEIIEQYTKDGKFDELINAKFDSYDLNCDGEIDFNEWRFHYESIGVPLQYAQASFDAVDRDHNGVISREEFLAYHKEYFLSSENKLNSAILFGPLVDE